MSGKEFKELLDHVTANSGSEPNWAGIMELVEHIKTRTTSPKKASQELRKKLADDSESVVLNTLMILDSVVKNTPAKVHKDFLTSELLGSMKSVVENQGTKMAKAVDRILELLGEWKAAFGDDNNYTRITTILNDLEREGYFIPEAQVNTANYMKAPSFQTADNCFYCNKEFGKGMYKGRHHCRNCGKSICSKCMGESAIALPHLGIEKKEKVCVKCYDKLEKHGSGSNDVSTDNKPINDTTPTNQGGQTSDRDQELQEQEDIQMAIAMSLNEQENKKSSSVPVSHPPPASTSPRNTHVEYSTVVPSAPPTSVPYTPIYADLDFSNTTPPTAPTNAPATNPVDEFDQYLSRAKREREAAVTQTQPTIQATPTEQASSKQTLVSTLKQLMERFSQRMQEVQNKGGSIATDPAILSMHQDLTAMHLKLLEQVDEAQEHHAAQVKILHKLDEAKEARVTLDTMRRRHQEQLLQQEREQQALAQMQVQMKLALLRQQKAEQLAYGQTMQSQRLERLNTQRMEYENRITSEREQMRQQLIAQEQKVFQQQFGSMETVPHVPPTVEAPPTINYNPPYQQPSSQYMGVAQGEPLPVKADPPPPPYQSPLYQPSLYQPSDPSTSNAPTYQAPSYNYAPPQNPPTNVPQQQTYTVPQNYEAAPSTGVSYQPNHTQTGGVSSHLQRPPSQPPLIVFD